LFGSGGYGEHRDPFDRMLTTQVNNEGLWIASGDGLIKLLG
jgi:PIN domain nuclease of toxin-antitoxin system